jgi:hypothetical protein
MLQYIAANLGKSQKCAAIAAIFAENRDPI